MTDFIGANLPYLLGGISVGGQYALIAIGYTMVYGILRLINFAHGDIFTVAGFLMVYMSATMPLAVSLPLTIALTVLLGENFAYLFRDTKRPEGHNMVDTSSMYMMEEGQQATEKPTPYFDPLNTPLELVVETTVNGKTQTKSYPLKPEGKLKEDYAKGGETADGMLLFDEELSRILAEARRGTDAANRKSKGYPQVIVKVKDISRVAEVESQIKQMGYVTNSMESIRKPMEKEAQEKQMMLGGLGAISLLVAALGITNTMIMSISERTREIGIMKALGYDGYMVALEALKKADSGDRQDIADIMDQVTFDGVTGAIVFGENGDAVRDQAFIKKSDNATGAWTFVKVQGITAK